MESLRNPKTHPFSTLVIIFSSLCLLISTSISANYVGAEGGFDYDPCSNKGPEHWGELKEEWGMCKYGKRQSPISLSWWTAGFFRGGVLQRNHRPGNAILKNHGHDISVIWAANVGSIPINGIHYHLQNFHWHRPSEHTIEGKRYPLELHMVHTNYEANVTHNIAVVAVLYEFGPSDPLLSRLEWDIKGFNVSGAEKWVGRVDPKLASVNGDDYFRYLGSLTTPPCSEGVIWTVYQQISSVSPEQVELLKQAVVEMNARPLQKVNGRQVGFFDPRLREMAADQ